jgi:hypothetical protein
MQGGESLVGSNNESQSRKSFLSYFNVDFSKLSYGKVVRASFLLLFILSCLICLFNPGAQTSTVAILSLIAFVCFDVVCVVKSNLKKDESEDEIIKLKEDNEKLKKDFQYLKDELTLGTANAIFSRRK